MKCKQCASENKKSCVYSNGTSTTLMYYQPYYDENENYHYHDENKTTAHYSCSNGHQWNEIEPLKICYTCGWPNEGNKNDNE